MKVDNAKSICFYLVYQNQEKALCTKRLGSEFQTGNVNVGYCRGATEKSTATKTEKNITKK
jgi:hypothetical protein